MGNTIDFDELPDSQEIALTKKELVDKMQDFATLKIGEFCCECMQMASDNWCSEHITMLARVFSAVINQVPYSEAPVEDKTNDNKGSD